MPRRENVLSNTEEEDLIKAVREASLKACDPVVREFAQCSKGRTVTSSWACSKQWKAVKECVAKYNNDETREKIRQAIIAESNARAAP